MGGNGAPDKMKLSRETALPHGRIAWDVFERVTVGVEMSELQQELAALRAENARLREELSTSNELVRQLGDAVGARDSFIAIAGHELRNPMGAILVAATNIAHRLSRGDDAVPPWLVARVATLERQARAFVRRATTLLDVSRITGGQLRLDPESVDISRALRETLESLGHELDQSKSTLTSAIEDGVTGWWDRVALDQILYNLVHNALKYGAGKPIRVELVTLGGRAVVSVADQGIGISPGDRERIFSRFERAVTQRTHGGFGVGLWITRGLVDALGGTIRVESEPGAGSIFTVELPQALELAPR